MRLQITESNVVYSSDVKDVLCKIIQLRLVKEQPEMSEFRYGKGNELNLTGVISKKQLKLISNACGFFMKTTIIKIKIYI